MPYLAGHRATPPKANFLAYNAPNMALNVASFHLCAFSDIVFCLL